MIKAGIIGGTGYTGVELLRLLHNHKEVEVVAISSRSLNGKRVDSIFPSLVGQTDLSFSLPDDTSLNDCDVIFFATPHGVAMEGAGAFIKKGIKVIDLGADFRITDAIEWSKWYGMEHTQPELLRKAVYGLPENNREQIKKAELIAKLRADGKHVGYVGDGINDAIALKGANVSISLSGASTVATDTAQIILMDGDLARIESLFEISKAFEKNMKTNYLNSMIPGVITLSGVFLFHMGLIGALVVYFTSEVLALTNCMMPLIKDEMSEDETSWKLKDDTVSEPVDMTLNYLVETTVCDPVESESETELVPDSA